MKKVVIRDKAGLSAEGEGRSSRAKPPGGEGADAVGEMRSGKYLGPGHIGREHCQDLDFLREEDDWLLCQNRRGVG